MISKTTLKMLVMIGVFAFVSMFDSSINQALGQDCPDTEETDTAIVKSVYEAIKTHKNKKLKDQLPHINITSKNRVIQIQGWASTKKDHKAIIDIANKAKCGKMVNVNLFTTGKAAYDKLIADVVKTNQFEAQRMKSCGECGDICVPECSGFND